MSGSGAVCGAVSLIVGSVVVAAFLVHGAREIMERARARTQKDPLA